MRPRKKSSLHTRLALAVSVLVVSLGCLATARRGPAFWRPGPLVDSAAFGIYEVRIYCRHEQNLLEKISCRLPSPLSKLQFRIPGLREWNGVEVLKNGRRVYSAYGTGLRIAEFGSNRVAGVDITGNGIPNLALTDDLGRQGGGSFLLFECGEEFRPKANIESLGKYPELQDLDGDGFPELIVSDDAFYHWPVCMDGEPIPEVVLRWRDGRFAPAADLMRRPAPSLAELESLAAQVRTSPEWNTETGWVPEALWTNAVALLYAGHEDLSSRFVDLAWKQGFPANGEGSKDELIDYWLRGRLEESIYWKQICTANKP